MPGERVRAKLLGQDAVAQFASAPDLVSVMLDIETACEQAWSARLSNAPAGVLTKGERFALPWVSVS